MPVDLDHAAGIGAAVVLGPIFGSFVTALTYRLPRGESIAAGRSRCPACHHELTVPDLVPLVSWLAHRGRCRHCGTAISPRYPIIEASSLALFLGAALLIADPVRLALVFVFAPIGLALSVIDFEHQRLPDSLVALLVPFAIAWRWHSGEGLLSALIAAAVTFALLLAMDQIISWRTGENGIGGGDAKMIACAAFCLPVPLFLAFLIVTGAGGLPLGVWWRRRTGQKRFPFGIAILFAWWLSLLVPPLPLG